jgi:predicted nucleotidyltransferase
VIALVRDKQDALLWLCARYRVKRLGLFGSATGEDFDPAHSDLVMIGAVQNPYFLEGIESTRTVLYAAA